MKNLHISSDLTLPPDAVSRTFGLLAVRGAGKSNAAAVMAEEMFDAHLPFVAIDPVGSFWGLRSSSDGSGPGLPIPIFGGKHGDLPLERGAGELVADLIVSKRLSCVIDLSSFDSEGSKKAFLLAFARRLYAKNEDPLHLFLEEADDYIPQKPMRDEAELLRAWENIVRRGRSRGLGITLITQRSAAINKMVLTQVETLFAMRTSGPQDIASIEAWIKYHQVGQEVISSLAALNDGDAWVWSPQFLKTMRRIHFRQRRTFDSGATPKNLTGKATRPPATLADVNLTELQTQMTATIEKAKADDPRELRREILSLKKEILSLKQQTPATPKAERIEVPVLAEWEIAELNDSIHQLEAAVAEVGKQASSLRSSLSEIVRPPTPAPQQPLKVTTSPAVHKTVTSGPSVPKSDSGLGRAERAILTAIAQINRITGGACSRLQASILSGYSIKSSSFSNAVGALRGGDYVRGSGDDNYATPAGCDLIGSIPQPLGGEQLLQFWLPKLGAAERAMLQNVVSHQSLSKADISRLTGYSITSSSFSNALGKLRSLGLATGRDPIEANELFFH